MILQVLCGCRAFLLTIGEELRKYLVIGRNKSFGNLEYYTGLFEMIVGVLTTCHTQYT